MKFKRLSAGDPAPWFRISSLSNPEFRFDTVGGRYIVLAFLGSAQHEQAQASIQAVKARPDLFDDRKASFFGLTNDPADAAENRIADSYPGYRFFIDRDFVVSRAFGAVALEEDARDVVMRWVVLDPLLRVIRVIPFNGAREDIAELFALLDDLPDMDDYPGGGLHAPVLVLPNVFEPDFCAELIDHYERDGGSESGFMREVDGKTVIVTDPMHKRRKDVVVTEESLVLGAQERVIRRLVPEIQKAFQFRATRMERYIVACYAAEDGAHFKAHRDNTTAGTAHRRFALSINLNDDFDGGEVSFPEFGRKRFRAPPGGAVVFSCSLLHEVSPVTRGRRFAFLPFLYDDQAARIRQANNKNLGEGVTAYRMAQG